MAFSEFEIKKLEKTVGAFIEKQRSPVSLRKELDLAFRIENQSVVIYEVRPAWWQPNEIIEQNVAKATFVKTQNLWKIYWQRADLKWHTYEPVETVKSIDDFLTVVKNDEYHCFYG
jgi:hypothetical protein